MKLLDNAYISFVNLDHRKDRLERMHKSLSKAGLEAVRTRGMLPEEYKGPAHKIAAMLARPQKGAIGCHFSQVSIMEAAQKQEKHAFVMEDDLVFCEDFQKRMDMIDTFTSNNDWDVIWLGGTFHVNPPYWHHPGGRGGRPDLNRDAELTNHPHMIRTYGAFCTYAYIVNAKSLGKVLMMLDAGLPWSIGIDHLFIKIQPQLKAFAFVPGCIMQYDHLSDIGVDKFGKPAMTKFSGFSKLGPYWFQNKLEDFDPTTYNWHEAKRK